MVIEEQFLVEHDDLIKKLAKYNRVYGYEKEDLEQEFRMVLMGCIKNFDESKNTLFTTYFTKSCINHLNKLRKKNKDNPLSLDIESFYYIEDNKDVNELFLRKEVLKSLEEMPYGEWTKLNLVYNIPQVDIAEVENVSKSWLNKKIKETVEKLKEMYL